MAASKNTLNRRHRFAAIVITASLICGWAAGLFIQHDDTADVLGEALIGAVRFESGAENIYTGYVNDRSNSEIAGYVAVRSADGYAGPVTVAVGMTVEGQIVNAVIVRNTESKAFFMRVLDRGYPGIFKEMDWTSKFEIGDDVDSVTGATVSLEAISKAVRNACTDIATSRLGYPAVANDKTEVQFGFPEIVLIVLVVLGFAAYGGKVPVTSYVKWGVLTASIIFIGFVFRKHVTIINVSSLLVGYWPSWQNGIYWYILVAAVLLPVILNGKMPYCSNICPFGATQEILIKVGGKPRQLTGNQRRIFRLVQRVLAWTAVMCALVFRNPAMVTYDVSGTFFTIIGQNWQFVLLSVFLIGSLFVVRPWCNCLCPLRAVFDYIRLVRRCFIPDKEESS